MTVYWVGVLFLVVRVGRRGTLVIPKPVRDALCISEGSLLELEVRGDEIVLRLLDPLKRAQCRRLREAAEKKAREAREEPCIGERGEEQGPCWA